MAAVWRHQAGDGFKREAFARTGLAKQHGVLAGGLQLYVQLKAAFAGMQGFLDGNIKHAAP